MSSGLHEDVQVVGCSDSEGEEAYNLDGEELWFADFVNNRGVEPQPSFIDHMTYEEGAYQAAVGNQQACKANLGVVRQAMKDFKLENGKNKQILLSVQQKIIHVYKSRKSSVSCVLSRSYYWCWLPVTSH